MRLMFDFNNLAIRNLFVEGVDIEGDSPSFPYWKYLIINSIFMSLSKDDVTEVVLGVDSPNVWRKIIWPNYKRMRKVKRDASKINWDVVYSEIESLSDDIKKHLPFKVIKAKFSEADDIIAVIARDGKPTTIVSNDEDYLQLCSDTVKVYNPTKRMFMECSNVEEFIQMKSLMGQPKDDIYNIKTPIDHPVDKRKPGFGEVSAKKVLKEGLQEWLRKNGLEKRYQLNRSLIDFNCIPNEICNNVLHIYNNYKLPSPDKIPALFEKHNFVSFMDNYLDIEPYLLKLY